MLMRTKRITAEITKILLESDLQSKEDYYDLFFKSDALVFDLNKIVTVFKLERLENIQDIKDVLDRIGIYSNDILMAIKNFITFKQEIGLDNYNLEEKNNMAYVESLNQLYEDISRYPLLDEREEEVIKKAQNGDKEAFELALNSNYRLVFKIAKNYYSTTMTTLDLFQEGYFGLVKAIKSFDSTRGCKFSTYACQRISASIRRAIEEKESLIYLPNRKINLLYKIKKFYREYLLKYDIEPSDEEIANYVNVDINLVQGLKKYNIEYMNITDELLENQCLDNEIEQHIVEKDLKEKVDLALDEINERYSYVLKRYFGVGYDETSTLRELGKELNISRTRIMQIKEKAFDSVKCKKYVKGFFD